MPVVIHTRADDEIADLIERVRSSRDQDVGLVIPGDSLALQTPLNARLLSQFSKSSGRRTAIVSDDPRIQELARANGLTVYASVLGYERGIEVVPVRTLPLTAATGLDGAAATAVQEAPPKTAARVSGAVPPTGMRVDPRRTRQVPPPAKPRGRDRRRVLYFAGAGVAIVGLLLFFALSPSAKITITVAATPLAVSPTIQGSADPATANQGDHILTTVVTSTAMNSFSANPSGHATLPATAATATERITTTFSGGAQGAIPKGSTFQTGDKSITFVVTQDTYLCIGPDGSPPPTNSCFNNGVAEPPNADIPIADQTPEAKGNVGASAITVWPQDPCLPANYNPPGHRPTECGPPTSDPFHVTNPQPANGGADQSQITVASSQDVSGWNNQVQQIENTLSTQVTTDMKTRAGSKTFAVDPGGGGKTVAFDVHPALPNAGDQYSNTNITITANGKAAVYDPSAVKHDVIADLQALVVQGDQLAMDKVNIQPAQVTQASDDGTVVINVTATAFSQPNVDLEGLKKQLAGKNPGDARKIIMARIDHVQSVQVSESPFTLFFLPLFSSRIQIDENFVAQTQASP